MKSHKINSLESLNRRIAVLEDETVFVERQLHQNWNFLKSNFGKMIRASIFKKFKADGSSSFIYWLLKIPAFNNTVGKTVEKITQKIETLVSKWIDTITD